MKKMERQTYFLGYCQFVIVRERRGQDQPGRSLLAFLLSLFIRLNEYPSPSRRCQVDSPRIINPNHQPDLQLKDSQCFAEKLLGAKSPSEKAARCKPSVHGENELLL
jgi:hypothetical protein